MITIPVYFACLQFVSEQSEQTSGPGSRKDSYAKVIGQLNEPPYNPILISPTVLYPGCQRVRAESRKHNAMNSADSHACQHGRHSQRWVRHVDSHSISLTDAMRAEDVSYLTSHFKETPITGNGPCQIRWDGYMDPICPELLRRPHRQPHCFVILSERNTFIDPALVVNFTEKWNFENFNAESIPYQEKQFLA